VLKLETIAFFSSHFRRLWIVASSYWVVSLSTKTTLSVPRRWWTIALLHGARWTCSNLNTNVCQPCRCCMQWVYALSLLKAVFKVWTASSWGERLIVLAIVRRISDFRQKMMQLLVFCLLPTACYIAFKRISFGLWTTRFKHLSEWMNEVLKWWVTLQISNSTFYVQHCTGQVW